MKTEKIKNIILICAMSLLLLSLSLGLAFLPKETFSTSERRTLAKMPEVSLDSFLRGKFVSGFEDYTLDHFPMRDGFRTLKAINENFVFAKMDNGGLYLSDGYISKLEYPLDEEMIKYASDKFVAVKDKYLSESGGNVYMSVVPDKNMFLAEKSGHLSLDYDMLTKILRSGTDGQGIEYIDIYQLLDAGDYYRTDTHWRQEKITDVADKLLSEMGAERTGAKYTERELDTPFYGVYYGQAAIPVKPDRIKYLESDILSDCTVDVLGATGNGVKSVYNMEKAGGKDPYEMFLSGAQSIITIENPHFEGEKKLVVFRDSFGSSLAPLLIEGYSKITLVDIRYIDSSLIGSYVDFENTDALFIYSTIMLNTAKILK